MPPAGFHTHDVIFREVPLGSSEYDAAIRLRESVLRKPLGLTLSAEEMTAEPECRHFVGLLEKDVIATLLLKPLDAQTVKMRQVAVEPGLQRSGVGTRLIEYAEASARGLGFRTIVAHARETALAFYERLGYAVEGEIFLENTIPHRRVSKALQSDSSREGR